MKKKELGDWGEELAVKYLKDKDYIIIERNYRTQFGEIDLIARDGDYLVFIEVKTRSNLQYGSPQAAVNYFKQQRIRKIASYYLLYCSALDEPVKIRFDVVAIHLEEDKEVIEHLENAF